MSICNIGGGGGTYLNFVEKFSIKKSELISDFMTAEVMKSSRPVQTQSQIFFARR